MLYFDKNNNNYYAAWLAQLQCTPEFVQAS